MTPRAPQQHAPPIWYLLPFVILALMASISWIPKQSAVIGAEAAVQTDPVRVAILGGAYLVAGVFCLARLRDWLWLSSRQWIYYLFLAFILASFLWSRFPAKVFIDFGHYLGCTLVATAAALHLRVHPRRAFAALLATSTVCVSISIYVAVALPAIGIDPLLGRWQGVAGNPNTLGLICTVGLWAALAGGLNASTWRARAACYALLPLFVLGLAATRSATSIVVSAFIAGALLVLTWLERDTVAGRLTKLAAITFIVAVALVAMLAFAPQWLLPDTALQSLGKDRTLTGRLAIWEFALQAYAAKPLFGWSFDSLASVLSTSNFSYGQFHNGYLDLAVRGGAVGLVLAMLVVLRLPLLAMAVARDQYRIGVAWLVAILAILIHNLTEASLFRTTHLYTLWLITGYCYLEFALRERIGVATGEARYEARRVAAASAAALPNLLR